MKVLLIEDRNIVITGIRDSLRRKSKGVVEVQCATSFYSAKELILYNNFDVILLDLNMARIDNDACFDEFPGTTLNGWLFLKNYVLGEQAPFKEQCKNSKIIIYSGYIDELRDFIKKLPENNEERKWINKVELVNKVLGEYSTITTKILNNLNN